VTGREGTVTGADGEAVGGGEGWEGGEDRVEKQAVEKWVEELSRVKRGLGDNRAGEDTSPHRMHLFHSIHSIHSIRVDSALQLMKSSALELLPTAEEVGVGVVACGG